MYSKFVIVKGVLRCSFDIYVNDDVRYGVFRELSSDYRKLVLKLLWIYMSFLIERRISTKASLKITKLQSKLLSIATTCSELYIK